MYKIVDRESDAVKSGGEFIPSMVLDYSKDGKVGVITIKNGKNNLMSFELLKALDKQLDAIEEANDVNG